MCFSSKPKPTATPAPAPEAPAPIAEEAQVADARRTEDKQNYGTTTPSLRVDRSATSGGVGADGSGLRM